MLIALSPSPTEKGPSVPILSPKRHLSEQSSGSAGCGEDAAPQAILTPERGHTVGRPPVRLPSAARACVQTEPFEEVLNHEQVNQKGEIKEGKALGRQGGGGVVGSTSKIWNKYLRHLLWMLRRTKPLSELLRENLPRTWIKGCLLHRPETPPKATGHPTQVSNPHLAPSTSQLTNHHWHQQATWCHAAATPSQLLTSSKVSAFIVPHPKHRYAGSLEDQSRHRGRMEACSRGSGRAGTGLLRQSLGWVGAAPAAPPRGRTVFRAEKSRSRMAGQGEASAYQTHQAPLRTAAVACHSGCALENHP